MRPWNLLNEVVRAKHSQQARHASGATALFLMCVGSAIKQHDASPPAICVLIDATAPEVDITRHYVTLPAKRRDSYFTYNQVTSMPCLHSPLVSASVPSASTIASSKNSWLCCFHTFNRVSL